MSRAAIVLPNQLFRLNPAVEVCAEVWLVEKKLYFEAHQFLQQKLVYTRACMKEYEATLFSQNRAVHYISSTEEAADIRRLTLHLKARGVDEVHLCDPVDDWLECRLGTASGVHGLAVVFHPLPGFHPLPRRGGGIQTAG